MIIFRVSGVLLDREGEVVDRDVIVGEVDADERAAVEIMAAAAGSGRWCDLRINKRGEE